MKHSRPSNVPSDVERPPTPIPEVDAPPIRLREGLGAEAFVVSAYEAHGAEVFAFLARATRDTSVAEDLLQEAFLRLAKEARDGRAPVAVRAWLYRVSSDLVIGRAGGRTTTLGWRGRQRRNEQEGLIAPSPGVGVLGRDPTAEIELALEGLSADARLALLLSGERFAGEEIAAALGRSVAATRTLLSRARARVRIRRDLFAEQTR